ncbi:MAG: NADH-quinone oxidoreductase subunit N [Bacteroidota bacterium]|nr:NADH-quinone oxidoreductase subunit N [Bacteroidota bacterium]MDP4272701.1 NADH-quinone oxidoreductase subunit N [Bacteroidota bacterium]
MNFGQMILMRNELLLVLVLLILLVAEIFTPENKKSRIINYSLVLLFLVTGVGFLPAHTGQLFGGMYQSSSLTILMKNILNIGTFIVFLQAAAWLKKEENQDRISEFFILMLSTLIGMDYMISSGDFLMLYLGLELATIPMAALVAYDRYKNRSAEAGVKFIMLAALSSGILLWGISMIYGTTGSFYFNQIAATYTGSPLQVLAFVFFFAGMAFKISLVPFHLWTADVYEGAPVAVTSYLSVISKGASVFILSIVLFTVFHSIAIQWQNALLVIAVLTMTIGNLFAMRQTNLKRFMAFSSISQAGFILVGLISGTVLSMTSVVYFVLVYIFSNLGVFGVISVISNKTGKEKMDDYNGLYRTNPMLSLLMLLALFSLAGIPPIAGFFSKFFLFTAAAEKGHFILIIIAVLNTIISLYYYLLIVKAMFINKSETPIASFKTDTLSRIGLVLCMIGIMVSGFASVIFEYIRTVSFGM